MEEITGYSRTWLYALEKRYNDLGISALCERRQKNQGSKPLIEDVEQAQLWQVLQTYVNTKLFNQVLADFAREFDNGAKQHILLAVDRAGWHISHDLKIPEGLHLTLLPPDSPALQPAERLWTLVDEPIANQSFETLNDLEDVLYHRCQSLLQQQDLIQGLTGFQWWTKIGV